MTPTELRVKVAEALGWTNVAESWFDDFGTQRFYWEGNRPGCQNVNVLHELPNFGAPDWSATGAVLDEIERRGWHAMIYTIDNECRVFADGVNGDLLGMGCDDDSIHVAICESFLEAHARAKEPT